MDVYLYNWTNPHDLKNKSTKPKFTQLGPYRFREFPDKLNISFGADNSTVFYRKYSTYYFDPDGSNGSLSDLCTTFNLVALGAAKKVQHSNFFAQKIVSFTLSSYNLHITKTVKELLFDGYKDSLVTLGKAFVNDTPFDSVGFLIQKNGTDIMSPYYGVSTGVDNIQELGKIKSLNNLTEFPFYEKECSKLRGSAGEFFNPEPSITEPIRLFTAEMCRSIPYDYEKDIDLHGLKGHRFLAGERALDNGTLYAENKCYATDELMPSGVMNISICSYGQPMFMSFPHFYGADATYLESVEGLDPVKEKHQSFMTLEPVRETYLGLNVMCIQRSLFSFQTTGITLEVAARFQTNVLIDAYAEYVTLFEGVPRIFMPLFWVEQKFSLDAEKSNELRFALNIPYIGQSIGIAMLILGSILMCIRHLRKSICSKSASETFQPNLAKSELGAVIDQEINPLMSTILIAKN